MAIVDKDFRQGVGEGSIKPVYLDGRKTQGNLRGAIASAEIKADDDNGSVYRLLQLPSDVMLVKAEFNNSAIAGGTNYRLALIKPKVDGFDFVNSLHTVGGDIMAYLSPVASMAVARPIGTNYDIACAMSSVSTDNYGQPLWKHVGRDKPLPEQYDLALIADVAGSVDGVVNVITQFVA